MGNERGAKDQTIAVDNAWAICWIISSADLLSPRLLRMIDRACVAKSASKPRTLSSNDCTSCSDSRSCQSEVIAANQKGVAPLALLDDGQGWIDRHTMPEPAERFSSDHSAIVHQGDGMPGIAGLKRGGFAREIRC